MNHSGADGNLQCYPVSSRRSASASVGPGKIGQNPMVPSFSVICRDFWEPFEVDFKVYKLRLQVTTVTRFECSSYTIQLRAWPSTVRSLGFEIDNFCILALPSVDVLWPLTLARFDGSLLRRDLCLTNCHNFWRMTERPLSLGRALARTHQVYKDMR